jgi:polyisoprenoid-binding protein YceI
METEITTVERSLGVPSGDWYVDPARSQVHFHTRAMLGLFPVLGRFERFAGVLHIDEASRATGDLRIEAASIATGIGKRDAHLRTTDFFAAEEHPYLTFNLSAIEPDKDAHQISGALRIRDRVLPIRARAILSSSGSEIRIAARFPVDHHAAGLGWAKPGMVRKVVDADLKLTLTREDLRG